MSANRLYKIRLKRFTKMLVLIALASSVTGCVSAGSSTGVWGSMNPYNWFSSKKSTANSLTQKPLPNAVPVDSSSMGATGRLGAAPQQNNTWFSSITTPLTKPFTSTEKPALPGDEALKLDVQPKQLNPQLFVQMARVYETKGDYASAIKQYEQALKVSPNNVEILLGMARAYDRKGDNSQAVATYTQASQLEPNNGVIFNDLGLCYARHEDLTKAHENLAKAVAIAPTSQLYRNNLATVMVQQGQYDAALKELVSVMPEPSAHYNIGFLAERFGNRAVALQHFQQAATLDPNLLAARQMIDKLQTTAGHIPSMEQVSAQAQGAVNQVQQSANNSIQAAELKIRNAIQSQASSLAPRYAEPITAPSDSYQSDYNPGTDGTAPAETTSPPANTPKPLPPLDQ